MSATCVDAQSALQDVAEVVGVEEAGLQHVVRWREQEPAPGLEHQVGDERTRSPTTTTSTSRGGVALHANAATRAPLVAVSLPVVAPT